MGIDPLPVPLVILFSRARSRIQDAGPVIVFHMCEIKMQGLMHKIKLQGYKRGQIESIKRKYETEQEPYVQEKIKKKVYSTGSSGTVVENLRTSHGEPSLLGTVPAVIRRRDRPRLSAGREPVEQQVDGGLRHRVAAARPSTPRRAAVLAARGAGLPRRLRAAGAVLGCLLRLGAGAGPPALQARGYLAEPEADGVRRRGGSHGLSSLASCTIELMLRWLAARMGWAQLDTCWNWMSKRSACCRSYTAEGIGGDSTGLLRI